MAAHGKILKYSSTFDSIISITNTIQQCAGYTRHHRFKRMGVRSPIASEGHTYPGMLHENEVSVVKLTRQFTMFQEKKL